MIKYLLATRNSHKKLQGFTLVELSVVIVIVGFVFSGVTAGNSLVGAARLRSQIAELQNYTSAFNSFSMQYNTIAGDMKNATDYWPVAGDATNGNGNGYLDPASDVSNPQLTNLELYTLFQHLSLAKLIAGKYNNTYSLGAVDIHNNICYAAIKTGGFYGSKVCIKG